MITQNHLLNAFLFLIPAVLFYLLMRWRKQNPTAATHQLHPGIVKLMHYKEIILIIVFGLASARSLYFWFSAQF